jgi:hypothetical protein
MKRFSTLNRWYEGINKKYHSQKNNINFDKFFRGVAVLGMSFLA